jgi:HNH endonuclease/AP2 domain
LILEKKSITQEYLQSVLDYDPETGIFRWKVKRGRRSKIDSVAGHMESDGYIRITIDGKHHSGHRLAWLYMFDDIPKFIDHIDGNPSDNRITNLRPCTPAQNGANSKMQSNNTTGYKGVIWRRRQKKWEAVTPKDGRQIYLGRYADPIAAHQAYCMAARELNGEFARFG